MNDRAKNESTLAKLIRGEKAQHAVKIKMLREHTEQFAAADAAVRSTSLRPEWNARVSNYMPWTDRGEVVCIRIEVDSFKEVLPLLEHLWACGYAFDKTRDDPSISTRAYYSPEGIMVEARLSGAAAGCKRVITGYTAGYVEPPQPIYAFECDEAPPADVEV